MWQFTHIQKTCNCQWHWLGLIAQILSIKMVQEPPKNNNLRYSPQITLHKVNMGTSKGFEGYLISFSYKGNFAIYRIKTEGIADMDIFVNKWYTCIPKWSLFLNSMSKKLECYSIFLFLPLLCRFNPAEPVVEKSVIL